MFTEKTTVYFPLTQMIFQTSGLLFFPSKCVMLGRVNIVGHGYICYKTDHTIQMWKTYLTIQT